MRLQRLSALSAAAVITLAFVAGANTTASVPPDLDAVLQHIDDLYRSKSWGCCCVDGVVGRTPQRVCAGREANPTVATD